jgi:hypothetical protein
VEDARSKGSSSTCGLEHLHACGTTGGNTGAQRVSAQRIATLQPQPFTTSMVAFQNSAVPCCFFALLCQHNKHTACCPATVSEAHTTQHQHHSPSQSLHSTVRMMMPASSSFPPTHLCEVLR